MQAVREQSVEVQLLLLTGTATGLGVDSARSAADGCVGTLSSVAHREFGKPAM